MAPAPLLDLARPSTLEEASVIARYIDKALRRARYTQPDAGVYCATVPGLRGVLATAPTLEVCRDQLAEVIEEWVLVRVSRGLPVPRLGGGEHA
jgi:predicted RNase H-like HicB family nuclease